MENTEQIKELTESVARICCVDKDEMLEVGQRKPQYAFPRWMLWMAIKRLTNCTNNTIAELTKDRNGKRHSYSNITSGISKMTKMTDNDYIWSQKWVLVKNVIKNMKKDFVESKQIPKITVIVPKGIEVEIKEK